MAIIDTDKIKELLSSDLTGYRASKLVDIRQQNYDKYKNGTLALENMTLKVASELMKLIEMEENKMEKGIKNFLEEVWENITWEGMEVVLYKDGDNWTRQQGSRGVDEDEVIYTLPLSLDYWADSYFMYRDEDGDVVKDETMKKDFMEDMESQIKQEIDL